MTPVETKVKSSTAAAALSGLALFALGRYVFKGSVPDVVASWTYAIVPALLTFAAGYLARHSPRPAAPAPASPSNVTVTPPAGAGADTGRQVAAAVRAYGGRRPSGMFVDPQQIPTSLMEPSMQAGQSATPEPAAPAEKTLLPPAAPE